MRVRLQLAEPYASAYPKDWGSAVTVVTRDGHRLQARRTCAKGDPEAPLSRDEIVAKTRLLLEYGGVQEPQRLIDGVLGLAVDGPIPELP